MGLFGFVSLPWEAVTAKYGGFQTPVMRVSVNNSLLSLVLSVLSMQFMPTSYRQLMLRQIYDSMAEDGALIYVEKVVAENLDDLMVDLYYQMKRENGYTDDQIMAKRRSLENVLSPLEPAWNEAMLKQAGFRKVEMFWRCLNFCGWIAVK